MSPVIRIGRSVRIHPKRQIWVRKEQYSFNYFQRFMLRYYLSVFMFQIDTLKLSL
jgi:hypothetical protein